MGILKQVIGLLTPENLGGQAPDLCPSERTTFELFADDVSDMAANAAEMTAETIGNDAGAIWLQLHLRLEAIAGEITATIAAARR